VTQSPDNPLNRGELLNSYYMLGLTLARMDRLPQAEDAFRQAIDIYEKAPTPMDRTGYRTVLPSLQSELGNVLAARGQTKEAEKAHRKAVILGEKLAYQFPDIPPYRQSLASYYLALAKTLVKNDRRDEAAKLGDLVIDLTEKLTAESTDETQPKYQSTRNLLGWGANLRDAGEFQGAEKALRKALELAKKVADEAPNDTSGQYRLAETYAALGSVLQRTRQYPEGADAYRAYLAVSEKLAAALPADPDYRHLKATAHNFLGVALRHLPKEMDNVVPHHRQAVQILEPLVVKFPNQTQYRRQLVRSHYALGITLTITGKWTEVESHYRQAITTAAPLADQTVDPIPSCHNNLAWVLATCPDGKLRDPKRAVELARKAVELAPKDAGIWNTLGAAEYRAGSYQEARAALYKSMQLRQGGDSFDWFFLAMVHWQLDEKGKAREWHDRAVQWMEKNQPTNAELGRFRTEAAELLGVK